MDNILLECYKSEAISVLMIEKARTWYHGTCKLVRSRHKAYFISVHITIGCASPSIKFKANFPKHSALKWLVTESETYDSLYTADFLYSTYCCNQCIYVLFVNVVEINVAWVVLYKTIWCSQFCIKHNSCAYSHLLVSIIT